MIFREQRTLLLIVLLSLSLNLLGITWGIPKDSYRELYYNDENISEVVSGISDDYVRRSWEMSRYLSEEEKIPRSVFNIIRSFHPDEHNIIKSLSNMSPFKGDFNPRFFEYPSFFIYYVGFLLGLASLTGLVALTSDISFYFMNPGEMGMFFLVGRAGVVFLSVLGVIFLYKAALNFFDRKTAAFSAFILAVSPLYVINSKYLTVDVPMVFWMIVSLYFLSLAVKNKSLKSFYLAAVFTGFAAGTKYPAVFMWLMFPVISHGFFPGKLFIKNLKALALTVSAFLLTTPYAILAANEFMRDVFYQVETRGFAGETNPVSLIADFISNSYVAAVSGFSFFSVFFVAGILFSFFRRGNIKLILAGFLFAVIPVILTGGLKYARYYLIIMPFAVILAGYLISFLSEKRCFQKPLLKFVLCLVLAFPAFKSFSYSINMSRPDARIVAAEYVRDNIPPGSTIIFTNEPWIFEVPPVNVYNYKVKVADKRNVVLEDDTETYLVLGELQYFLEYGSRLQAEKQLIKETETAGYKLEKIFMNPPGTRFLKFDNDLTIHDMVYTHPSIYLFRKI